MYERVPIEQLEAVLGYLRHQVREMEAELARRQRPARPAPARPARSRSAPARPVQAASGPVRWAVERNRYDPRRTSTLHTLDCAMSIGAPTVTEQEAHAMVRSGRGAMDCDCAR